MLKAFIGLPAELEIIGGGPLRADIEEEIERQKIKNVKLLGYLSGDSLFDRIRSSLAAIIPSECYENNPISILEAFALGKPVIGSRIGGIPEVIKEEKTGLLFESGNDRDLKNKIKQLLSKMDKVAQMSTNAIELVKRKYSPGSHYNRLIEIYSKEIEK